MKRLILTVTGTAGALAALLSFKTQSPVTNTAALPAASIGSSATTPTTVTPTTGGASSAASSTRARTAASTPARSYLGSAITTRYGVIQVKVTVKNRAITNVSFAQLTAFDGHSQQINSDAAPQLLKETLSAQSANVNTISGASYTSDGYRQSLQSALDRAGI